MPGRRAGWCWAGVWSVILTGQKVGPGVWAGEVWATAEGPPFPDAWSEEEEAEARGTRGGEGVTRALSLGPPLVAIGSAPTTCPSLSSQHRAAR